MDSRRVSTQDGGKARAAVGGPGNPRRGSRRAWPRARPTRFVAALGILLLPGILTAGGLPLAPTVAGADVTFPGVRNCDITGYWVKGAGDVNRDGYEDFLIGTPYAGDSIGGGMSLMAGAAAFEAEPLPETLDFTNPGDREYYYVALAAMRQDPYILDVEAPSQLRLLAGPVCQRDGPGIVYLIFGGEGGVGSGGSLPLSHLDGTNGLAFGGEVGNDAFGTGASGVGDINGDGFDDFCLGAPWSSDLAPNRNGYSYLVFGAPDCRWAAFPKLTSFGDDFADVTGSVISEVPTDLRIRFTGGLNVDYGVQITYPPSAAGRYLTGAPGAGFGPLIPYPGGAANQYLDKPVVFDPTNPDACGDFDPAFDPTGKIVLIDYAGGPSDCTFVSKVRRAQEAGAIAVLFANRSSAEYPFFVPQDEEIPDSDPILIPSMMTSAATADLLVDALEIGEARATLYPSLTMSAGHAVSGVGDIDGDGFEDMLFCGPFGDGIGADGIVRVNSGVVFVVYGRPFWPHCGDLDFPELRSQGLSSLVIGAGNDHWAGTLVSGAGDVNGDGYADFILGSSGVNIFAGEGYLVYGSPNRIGDSTGLLDLQTIADDQNGDGNPDGVRITRNGAPVDQFGGILSGAGDVNGDGYSDFLISAYLAGGVTGANYLFLGGADGLPSVGGTFSVDAAEADPSTATLRMIKFTGGHFADRAGIRVGSAGDVNGDGLDDFMIGADVYEPGSPDCCNYVYPPSCPDQCNYGAVYLIYGAQTWAKKHWYLAEAGCTGDPSSGCILEGDGVTTPAARMAGILGNDHAGLGAMGAGDVDGDGIADFLSAASWDRWTLTGTPRPGDAYLWYGQTELPFASYSTFHYPGHNYPPLTFSPKIGVGLIGNGANAIPASRCWIQYLGGSDPDNPNGSGASRETVTVYRSKGEFSGFWCPERIADVGWKVETTRTDWAPAIVTFKYTNAEIDGLDESRLFLCRASSPDGPWWPLISLTSRDVNEISTLVCSVGYFAIGQW